MRLPIHRRATAGRRSVHVPRRTSLVSRTRLLAALGLAGVSAAFYWISVSRQFAVDPAAVTISGATYTDTAAIQADLGLGPDDGSERAASARNLFRLPTNEMQRRIASLPAVLSAEVVASLPNRLAVVIHERVPILVWQSRDRGWLTDRAGVLLASAATAADAALPRIRDIRSDSPPVALGSRIDPMDLEAARLLGAVTPADLGSGAPRLEVTIEDADGWVLSVSGGWRAIFGHFTPDLHTTGDIPRQVQCLASLLANREASIRTVVLAIAPDRCGTFSETSPPPRASATPRGTGAPRPTPRPSSSPVTSARPSR